MGQGDLTTCSLVLRTRESPAPRTIPYKDCTHEQAIKGSNITEESADWLTEL